MKKLRTISLFSGIGAFEKAAEIIGQEIELVKYCDIDPNASKCFSALHNIAESENLGDITKVDIKGLPRNIDLITHGSSCQSFSLAGKQEGGEKGSGTKSSVIYNSMDIIFELLPKYVIWENVKNVLAPKHRPIFEDYLKQMEEHGYTNSWKVTDATEHGIPQKRERIICVSILNGVKFEFPKGYELPEDRRLEHFLDFRPEDDLTDNFIRRYETVKGVKVTRKEFVEYIDALPIKKGIGTKAMGLYDFNEMDTITMPTGVTGTITVRNIVNYCKKYWYNNRLYKPSPKMAWKLMGFTEEDFNKCAIFSNDNELCERAGNSIVVNVLVDIYKELFLSGNY